MYGFEQTNVSPDYYPKTRSSVALNTVPTQDTKYVVSNTMRLRELVETEAQRGRAVIVDILLSNSVLENQVKSTKFSTVWTDQRPGATGTTGDS